MSKTVTIVFREDRLVKVLCDEELDIKVKEVEVENENLQHESYDDTQDKICAGKKTIWSHY